MHKTTPQIIKNLRALFTLTILLSTIFLTPARAEFETSIEENRQVAIILPLSGPFADLGKSLQEGFEFGFAQHIESDRANHQFKTRFFDSEGNPETARTLIALLNSEGETVIAAGTPLNTTAWTASQASEESGLPYLIVGADQDNLITEKSFFTFRLTQTRSAINKMLSAFMDSQDPAIQSMGIIYGENYCAIHQSRRFRKFCANKNLDLAIWEVYRNNESNFYDLLNIIKERQPQLLLLATNPAAGKKLLQQGQRLELMPPLTIATPINSITTADKTTPSNHQGDRTIYATPWFKTNDQEVLPFLKNHLQAQGFAGAELILATLIKSPNLTSGEIVKTLETTTMTTVYGQVSFSGTGQRHQNPLPWHLYSYDENGEKQLLIPTPADQGNTTSEPKTTTLQNVKTPANKLVR